jgi:hypothetical protein
MTIRHALLAIVLGAACSSAPPKPAPPVVPKPTTPVCDAFFASPRLQRFLGMLDKLATIDAPPWSDYRTEQHPVVLLGPDRPAPPTCALVWRGHELARLALAEPVEMKIGPYRFWTSDPIGPHALPVMKGLGELMKSAPQDLVTALASIGVTRAMMLRIDFDPGPLAQLDLLRYFSSYDVLGFMWIVHETFHLYSQFPVWLDQPARYAWPAWDHQPSRPELVANCYGGKDAPLAKDEHAALFEAFGAVYRHSDRSAACAAVQKFLAARAARYASLADARVATAETPIGCEQAEAIMELEEAVPTYIANAVMLDLGVVSLDQVEVSFQQPVLEPFYGFGAFQLMVLRRLLDRDALRAATERIAKSADYKSSITHELASGCGSDRVRSN